MLITTKNGASEALPVAEYCIRHKYSGINELLFSIDTAIAGLVNEQIIDETTEQQRYLVKVINGDQITCELDLDDLRSNQTDYESTATASEHLSNGVSGTGWTVSSTSLTTTSRKISGSLSCLEIISAVMEEWPDLTVEYDTHEKTITLIRPEDNAPQFTFLTEQLNLKKLDIAGDSTSFCTRLRAKGANGLTFSSVNDGKDYVENYTYSDRVIYGTAIDDQRFTDADSLKAYAQAVLDANAIPRVSYSCDVVDVAAIDSDYSFQQLRIHKAAWLLDGIRNTRIAHRVVEYDVYPGNPSRNKVTLSTVTPSIQSSVKKLQGAIFNPASANRQREGAALSSASRAAAALITGNSGGYVVMKANASGQPEEILIMDTSDITTAQNVWRWNRNGLMHSSDGYSGTYANAAITKDGKIVADAITTGILTAIIIQSDEDAEGNRSTWNLSTGEMNLHNTNISTVASGHTYKTSDYAQEDLTRVSQLVVGSIVPTLTDYEKYDLNGDGKISITDVVQVQQILLGTRTVDFTVKWALKLDPSDGSNLIRVFRVWHNNLDDTDTEFSVLSAGFSNTRVNTLEAISVMVTTVDAENINVSGTIKMGDESLVIEGVIGYVVLCTSSSGYAASCFIPAGTTGNFQCASDDWFCSFYWDGSSATKQGGTGNVSNVKPVYNHQ